MFFLYRSVLNIYINYRTRYTKHNFSRCLSFGSADDNNVGEDSSELDELKKKLVI